MNRLSKSQLKVLKELHHWGPLGIEEYAYKYHRTWSPALYSLIRRKLVRKGKHKRVYITAKGKKAFEDINKPMQVVELLEKVKEVIRR